MSLTENLQKCEDQTNKEKEESVKEETPLSTSDSLPPYNPSNPVGKTHYHLTFVFCYIFACLLNV